MKPKERTLEALAEGATLTEAAGAAGVHRVTLWRWRKADSAFAAACAEATSASIGPLYDALYREACGRTEERVTVDIRERRDAEGIVVGTTVTTRTEVVWHRANIAAAALWLRNHDPNYIERREGDGTSAEDAARAALAAMAELEAKTAPPDTEN